MRSRLSGDLFVSGWTLSKLSASRAVLDSGDTPAFTFLRPSCDVVTWNRQSPKSNLLRMARKRPRNVL